MRRSRLTLRLVAYLSLLLVSVGAITWTIADLAADREVARADASLDATLRDVIAEHTEVQQDARFRALTLGRSRSVQRALARRDGAALGRLARSYPEARFVLPGGRRPAGQAVWVVAGGRPVGEVVIRVPTNGALLESLRRGAVVPPGDVLVLTVGRRLVSDPPGVRPTALPTGGRPTTVEAENAHYRALQAPLASTRKGLALAILRPQGPISDAADSLRHRVLYVGLAAFVVIAIVGYAAAPAIGRTRLEREQRAQASRILSHVRDGVVLVDADAVIRSWNHGAERITGVTAATVLGRNASEAAPGFAELAHAVPVATGVDEEARAVTAPLRQDGDEIWLSISGVGSEDGIVYVFRDLTGERRLERMRDEFVATVSHELRTPLASVYGAAMTLRQRGGGDDLQQQLVGILTGEAERLAQIVEEILLASQLTSGDLSLRLEPVDATGLAERAVDAARARLPANLSLELSTPVDLPLVRADESKARQVLGNLIENAVKYSPGGGRIELSLERQNGYVSIAVTDEGLGIPLTEQELIFEKFYRLDPDMTRGVGGTGLGLFICRELAERMGGRVRVTSQPGAGSTFRFELPVST